MHLKLSLIPTHTPKWIND